jgi:hypothetical protein
MAAANLVLFTAFPWIWEKKLGTRRGALSIFLIFLATFALFTLSLCLAAFDKSVCKVLFCIACCLNIPAVVSVWGFVREHAEDREVVEFKVERK